MSKRQSRFDIWSSSNKRDNGFSKNEKDDLISTIKTSRQQELESLKATITNGEKVRMKELLNICKSQIEFMTRLEDENININYLLALDITTEEDIQSYQSLRDRGIDTYSLQDSAKKKSVDNEYYREIVSMKREYPTLKNQQGKDIEHTIDLNKYIKEEAIFNQEKPREIEDVVNKKEQDVPSVIIDIQSLEDEVKEQASTEEEIKNANSWREILNGSKQTISVSEETSDVVISDDYVRGPSYMEFDNNTRQVFILAEEFATPTIQGYDFIFVKDSSFLSKFAVNKNNLLILTRDIPEYLINDFASWLEGVLNAKEKFRIATLQTSPIEHPIVQETLVRLDKMNLDNFYNEHKVEDYISESTGSFLDLSSLIEE